MPKLTEEEIKKIAELPMNDSDSGAVSIVDYLRRLLTTLWEEEEGFNGKRPLGNSAWQFDVYRVLIKANIVPGEFDEHDDIQEVDTKAADRVILQVIERMHV